MASTSFTILTPAVGGTSITASAGIVSADTITFSVNTAASTIDTATLVVRATNTNSTAAVTLTIGVGTEGSDLGIGTSTVAVGTESSVYIGGQGFESARYQTSGNTIIMTAAGAGPTTFEATQAPRAIE